MSSFDVILGNFVFQNHEIPDRLPFGGEQLFAENIMVGGDRVIDALGWHPGEIEWRGRFVGPSAESRALAIKAIAQAGVSVPLIWAGLYYTVLVTHYRPNMEKIFEIPYSISCLVVTDATQAATVFPSTTDQLVQSDMNTAQAKLGLTGVEGGTTGTSVSGGFGLSVAAP